MGETYLITGGAGFVGSNLAVLFKRSFPDIRVVALDNLHRRGSEFNLPHLQKQGVEFVKGDVRNPADLACVEKIDCLIECSAEASVLAGYGGSPEYVVQSNLVGALNCLEVARRQACPFVFLSTSRVYPYEKINALDFCEKESRFDLADAQGLAGVSAAGIAENFTLEGKRSLYGATKLAAELVALEYADMYSIPVIIDRCGLIAGPRQMGKMDQGIVALWMAAHAYGRNLSYIGYGAGGKQVRDVLHVFDLFDLLKIQMEAPEKFSGRVFNVGGGIKNSVSLVELTALCEEISSQKIEFSRVSETRPADIKWYVTDNSCVTRATGWQAKRDVKTVLRDIHDWILSDKDLLKGIFL